MKVSVIIPTFNRPGYLHESIRSVVNQTMPGDQYEIIVVNDGGDGPDAEAVCRAFPGVRYVSLAENGGQSRAVNFGILCARGEYIAIQHDDDLSYPDRLLSLAAALDADPKAGIAAGRSDVIDAAGDIDYVATQDRERGYWVRCRAGANLINQAWKSHCDGQSSMYRRTMMDELGGYREALVHGEELDLHCRASMAGWRILFVDKLLASYRVHDTNKSMDGGVRHKRARDVGEEIRKGYRDPIWVNISSRAEREAGLKTAIESLLPQCDRLNVFLARYKDVPEFCQHEKIHWAIDNDGRFDMGSCEKFAFLSVHPPHSGYYITCDDDILYPPDYVEKLILGIERHERKAICGFHGAKIHKWPVSDYYAERECLHFNKNVSSDEPVEVIGNVCAGFHTDTIRPAMSDFEGNHGQDDIHLSCLAQRHGVPRIVLAHDADWIKLNPAIDQSDSIYQTYSASAERRDAIAADLNAAFCAQMVPA